MSNMSERMETTLDEPVSVTLKRELRNIGDKMYKVVLPNSKLNSANELRNWDLWGPLIICLVLAIMLSSGSASGQYGGKGSKHSAADQNAVVFASVFVIVWFGAAVVTVNAVLLKGSVSFFQSICVLGYCIFPLTLSALVCLGVGWSGCRSTLCLMVRLASVGVGLLWSTRASIGFLAEVVPPKRSALAAYPVVLFYASIAWIIVIRSSP
uniref:Protein YIPF n=1 Tax=Hemiselmis andersenii TaxID=464988 RepID=A0A6U2BJ79_HEMAN|mmetsp:Transcript_17027/g.39282  ORF Transcript_17027/g.39282 Transcript_17027/m.39282 type:complete len:210 (+) Transcript_17027:59-688(+)